MSGKTWKALDKVSLPSIFSSGLRGLFITILGVAALSSCRSSRSTIIDFVDGRYEGMIDRSGHKHGEGVYVWLDGCRYKGDFLKDKRHGRGRFTWGTGEVYEGDYRQGRRTGRGTYHWADGSTYLGEFLNGKRHGQGSFTAFDGGQFEGHWFNDLQDGEGVLVRADGTDLVGLWREGRPLAFPLSD